MGLVEFLRQWERGRLAAGIGISILLHLVLIFMAVGIRLPGRVDVKRGEPLIVELPRGDDSPPPGDGGAPASKPSPPPAPPVPKTQARPAAPAPKVAAVPAPRPAAPARQPALPAPRPEPAQSRQVASAPAVPTADTGSVPAPQPAPAQPTPPQPAASQPAPSNSDAPSPPESTPAESTPQPSTPRQLASLPPQPAGRAAPDTLSALRRGGGGAGGRGEGHTGIEGEPIPLDSTDPRYSDYLDQIRRRIKDKWGYPCEKNEETKVCEYRSTQLLIDFGIYKNGELAYVTLVRTSGHPIYDDYALNAVKLASPFPPIPDSFSKTGVPIKANFHYVLQTSLTNILK